MERKFDFDDITIVPETISTIRSRKEVDISVDDILPLINAPMYDVINEDNYMKFLYSNILTITARNHNVDNPNVFSSYSLEEFEKEFILDKKDKDGNYKVLIDIANGHMENLLNVVKEAKSYYTNMTLMVGNIANPETYRKLSEAGADLIRVIVGAGKGCLTAENIGVYYPVASLLYETYQIKKEMELSGLHTAKIIADGGMKKYSDIIKALLFSDMVMLGSILSKTLESAGDKFLWKKIKITNKYLQKYFMKKGWLYVRFRGMSSKSIQKEMRNREIKTSEGVTRFLKVEYTLDGWLENFKHYLASAMSYTNSRNLTEFKDSKFVQITENSYKRFNK